MLITRKSHRPSDETPFRSRFRDPASGAFALRQYLRCRDEFFQRLVVTVVQACFAVFLLLFGRTMHRLFAIHGRHLPGWVELVCQALVVLFALLIVRRIVQNVRGIADLRGEMALLRRDMTSRDAGG